MKGAILQPTYLPWMGYFEFINSSDIFVVFDHVQFEKQSWQQRNRIKTSHGVVWLTMPVTKAPYTTRICDMKIANDQKSPLKKHWRIITEAYKKAPYFEKYSPLFDKIYSEKYVLLRDLNVKIIKLMCDILGIKKEFIFSSELNLNDENMGKTEKIVNLCKKMGITDFYEAGGGKGLFDESLLRKEGISISFQDFKHPEYPQLWGEFVPYLSAIDLIFNQGDKSLSIIKSGIKL